jgi:hypothetical protein
MPFTSAVASRIVLPQFFDSSSASCRVRSLMSANGARGVLYPSVGDPRQYLASGGVERLVGLAVRCGRALAADQQFFGGDGKRHGVLPHASAPDAPLRRA